MRMYAVAAWNKSKNKARYLYAREDAAFSSVNGTCRRRRRDISYIVFI